jgi:hypothetical protein
MVPSSPIGVDVGERVEILIVVVPDLALLRRTCYEPVDSTHPDTQGIDSWTCVREVQQLNYH